MHAKKNLIVLSLLLAGGWMGGSIWFRLFTDKPVLYGVGGVLPVLFGGWFYFKYLMPGYRRSWTERVDWTLRGGIGKQLIVLSVVVLAVVGLCVMVSYGFTEGVFEPADATGRAWGVICHFLDPGNLYKQKSFSMRLFSLMVSGLGMALTSGLLISTFSNIIQRRVDRLDRGLVVYPAIKDHYVIIGYGKTAICLILDIFRRNGWNETAESAARQPKIILSTCQDIHRVRTEIISYLPRRIEKKLLVYSGSAASEEHLSHLNINCAREVYILAEKDKSGCDVGNLQCVKKLAHLRGKGKELLPVNMLFDRMPFYIAIQRLGIPPDAIRCEEKVNLYFHPFNFHENWARLLWSFYADREQYDPLDFEEMEGDKHVHLFIMGFNRMGTALLLEALRLCHYPNFVEADPETGTDAINRTVITVVDPEMDRLLPFFRLQYPYLSQITDIEVEYLQAGAEDVWVRERVEAAAQDDSALLTIAVCLKDPDASLALGLNLPESVYYRLEKVSVGGKEMWENRTRARVLIRQELPRDFEGVWDKDQAKYGRVRIFGALTRGISHELLDDTLAMYVNGFFEIQQGVPTDSAKEVVITELQKYVEEKKRKHPEKAGRVLTEWLFDADEYEFMKHVVRELWYLQSEDFRFSNRYQVDIYATYYKYRKHPKLAQMEHLRWCADKSIVGYKDMHREGIKDTDLKLHRLLVPFNQLDKEERTRKEKKKDEDVVRNIELLLELMCKQEDVLSRHIRRNLKRENDMKKEKGNEGKLYDVFISYRREGGAEKANLVKKELLLNGYAETDIFLDVHTMNQGDFSEKIAKAIRQSRSFILIVGKNTFDRCKQPKDWLRKEIEIALIHSIPIIPIFFDHISNIEQTEVPASLVKICTQNGVRFDPEYSFFFYNKLKPFLPEKPGKASALREKKTAQKIFVAFKKIGKYGKILILLLLAGILVWGLGRMLVPDRSLGYLNASVPPLPASTHAISSSLFQEDTSPYLSVKEAPSYELLPLADEALQAAQQMDTYGLIERYVAYYNRTKNPEAIYNIAMLYRKSEGTTGANYRAWLKKGIDLQEGNCLYVSAMEQVSFTNWHQKGKTEREGMLAKLKEAGKRGSLEALSVLGQVYYLDGDTVNAEKTLLEVCDKIERIKLPYQVPMVLSEIYRKSNRYEKAYQYAEMASQSDDKWNLGLRYFIACLGANKAGRRDDKQLYQLVERLNRSGMNEVWSWEAQLYYEGVGCKKDLAKTIDLVEKGLVKSHTYSAAMDLGYIVSLLYYYGIGTEKNDQKAFEIIRKVGTNEYGSSYIREIKYLLGYMYHQGIGCTANKDSALIYYTESEKANGGTMLYKPTQTQLAVLMLEENPHSLEKRRAALEKLRYASQTSIKQYMWGGIYLKDTLQGVPQASYNIGVYYHNRLDTVPNQADSAFNYFLDAASKDVKEAKEILRKK